MQSSVADVKNHVLAARAKVEGVRHRSRGQGDTLRAVGNSLEPKIVANERQTTHPVLRTHWLRFWGKHGSMYNAGLLAGSAYLTITWG